MKNLLVLIIPVFIVLCFSCKSEKSSNSELEAYKIKAQNDSILLAEMGSEMEDIDKVISEISEYTKSGDLKENIVDIKKLIEDKTKKITELEEKIKNSNSSFKNASALTRSLETQRKTIEDQKILIEKLYDENGKLKNDIKIKEGEIKGLEGIVSTKTGENEALNNKVEEARRKLQQLEADIKQAENQKDAYIRQRQKDYAKMANELLELAKEISGNKAEKKEMTIKAFNYYCDLHKEGVYSAMSEITKIKADKKLGKFVQDLDCIR